MAGETVQFTEEKETLFIMLYAKARDYRARSDPGECIVSSSEIDARHEELRAIVTP